jgi:hypothetical protein
VLVTNLSRFDSRFLLHVRYLHFFISLVQPVVNKQLGPASLSTRFSLFQTRNKNKIQTKKLAVKKLKIQTNIENRKREKRVEREAGPSCLLTTGWTREIKK